MSTWYGNLSERVDTRPDFSRDWKWLLALCLVVYLICLGVRFIELSSWDHPGLMAAGEHIQSTHDAYYWMAGAKGIRTVSYSELGNLTKFLAEDLGFGYSAVAFWTPVLIGGLTGVAVCIWGWLLAGRTGGFAAGILAGLAKGFFVRTRFGYYDSDMFTLLGPVVAGLLVAILLRPYLRVGGSGEPPAVGDLALLKQFGLALVLGLVARTCWWWHQDIYTLLVAFFWLSVLLVGVLGHSGRRGEAFALLAAFWSACLAKSGIWLNSFHWYEDYFMGLILAVVAGFLLLCRRKRRSIPELALGTGALLLLIIGSQLAVTPLQIAWSQVAPYLMPASAPALSAGASASGTVADPVIYPAITQSIIEAKQVAWSALFDRMAPIPWLAAVGVLGFLVVCFLRPSALFLLPLLAVGLASKKMGVRFTMFALPAVGLGLSVPLVWAVQAFSPQRFRRWLVWGAQAVLGLFLLVPMIAEYWDYPLTPVLFKPDVEALAELKNISEPDSVVWTWWDWGYATQHYAERVTPSDGGLHSGRDVYPVALALSTDSFRQAANVIRYSADHGLKPAQQWDSMEAEDVRALLEGFRETDYQTGDIADQYLVATWANVRLIGWITTFGGWDLVRGQGSKAISTPLRGMPFKLDPARGAVVFEGGKRPPLPVSSVDLLDGKGLKHQDFFMNTGPHLVINHGQRNSYLMDDRAYYSMMVQLMVADPNNVSIREQFELVYEGSPHVRVYRVR